MLVRPSSTSCPSLYPDDQRYVWERNRYHVVSPLYKYGRRHRATTRTRVCTVTVSPPFQVGTRGRGRFVTPPTDIRSRKDVSPYSLRHHLPPSTRSLVSVHGGTTSREYQSTPDNDVFDTIPGSSLWGRPVGSDVTFIRTDPTPRSSSIVCRPRESSLVGVEYPS